MPGSGVVATVVIPARDAEDSIRVTLDAVAVQTIRSGLHVIVVDDGSEDSTVAVAGQVADEVLSAPRRGVAHARNAGLAGCRTRWMLTTDADTRPREDWAERHLIRLEATDASVAGTAGSIVPYPSASWWSRREDATPHPAFDAGTPLYAVTANAGFRVDVVRELGGFPPYLADDAAFGAVARRAGYRFELAPDAVVEHRNPETAAEYYRQMWKVGRYAAELDGPPDRRARHALAGAWRTLKVSRHFLAGRPRVGAAECLKAVGVTRGALSLKSGGS